MKFDIFDGKKITPDFVREKHPNIKYHKKYYYKWQLTNSDFMANKA